MREDSSARRVNVRQQAVASFDVAAANRFVLRAVDPDFLHQRALGGVVAEERIESSDLNPAGEQVGWRRAVESADVGAHERNSAEAEIEQLLRGQAKMVPGGGIVSGPGEAVALSAGEGRAGKDEGTLVGAQLEQAVVGGAGILQSDDVVNLGVSRGAGGETGLLDAMNIVERHGLARSVKDRGLVHVIPESGDAVFNEVLVEAAPPVARLGAGEVRKDRRARPHDADELAAVGFLHEVVARLAGVVRRVALVGDVSDVQIGNQDEVEVLLAQI